MNQSMKAMDEKHTKDRHACAHWRDDADIDRRVHLIRIKKTSSTMDVVKAPSVRSSILIAC